MAKIEERILSMRFDNAQFKRAAADTQKDLNNLKKGLKLDGVKSGLDGVAKASSKSLGSIASNASKINLSPLAQSVDEVGRSFTALEAISFGAFASIGGIAVNKAISGVKKLTNMIVNPIMQGGMNRARNLEQANFMLSGLFSKLDDQARKSKIDEVMAAANNSVTGTAFGLDEAAKAAAQLTASQVPLDKLEGSLRGIAGTASMTGSGFEEIANIFTTVAGNGRMMGQELGMLSSRGLNAAASIGEHLGVTEAEVREMASKGKISFEIFSDAMEGAFGAQAARANETYSGSLSNLKAALGRIGADVATVYLEKMRDLFNELRPAVNAVHNVMKPFIGLLNDRFRASIDSVIRPIKTFTTALEQFNKTGASSSKGWTTFFKLMQDIGMIASLVADVVRDAIGVMFGASPRFIEMSDTVTSAGTKIQHIFRKLLSVLMLGPEIIGAIFKAVLGLSDSTGSFGGTLLDIIDHFASMLYLMAEWIRESTIIQTVVGVIAFGIRMVLKVATAAGKVLGFFVGLIAKLYHAMDPVFSGIFRLISRVKGILESFFGTLKDFSVGTVTKIGKSITSWFGRIFDSIKSFDLKDLWKSIKSFRLPKINISQFKGLEGIISTITRGIDRLKGFVGGIDWSPLTNAFQNYQLPNLGDVSSFAKGIGGQIKTGFGNINADGIKNFASNVAIQARNAGEFIRNVDYAGIWDTVKNTFIRGAQATASGIKSFGTWVSTAISNVDWKAVGSTIVEGFISAVKMTVNAAESVGTFISDMFTSAIDSVDWGGIVDGVKDFGEGVKESFSGIFDVFKEEKIDTSAIDDAVAESTKDVTVKVQADLSSQTKGVKETITDFFGALFGTGPAISAEDSELIAGTKDFGSKVSGIAGAIKSPFATAKAAVMGEVGSFGETMKSTATGLLEGVNLVEILNGIGLAFTGAGIFSLAESVEKLAAVPEALTGAIKEVGNSFKAMGDSFKKIGDAAKIEAQGNAILKIAGAVVILAAAVWFMSKIPWDQMKVGLGAVLGLLAGLVAAVVILDKTISEEGSAKIDSLSNAMMKMGIAIGIMAAAVWILGNMDPKTIFQGLAAALGTILVLAAGVGIAGLTKSLTGMGTAFMGLALGVAILAGAFILFKFINWDEIAKGLTTLGVAVLAISFAARIADGKKLAGAGLAMLGLGTGLLALAYGLKAIAALDEQQLTQGLLVLGGVMLAITGMSRFGGKLTATAGALVGVAFAMVGLAYAIGMIADIDFWDAAGGMAVIAVGMIGLGLAMRAFPKDMPKIAGSLLSIAGALAILVGAIWVIGNMDTEVVKQGVLVLAGALGSLALALYFMKPTAGKDMMVLGAGMVVLAGSMLILAVAMKTFNEVEWDSLKKAGLVLGGLLVTLGLMGLFGEAAGVGIAVLGVGLAVFGAGLLVIAGAAWVFADAVAKIVDALNDLKDSGSQIKDALKEIGEGITLFADEAKAGFESLFDTIGLTDLPKIGSLVKMFESFDSIPDGMDVRLKSLADGLTSLQNATPAIESLQNVSGGTGLADFFDDFAGIDPDAGANLQSLADTLAGFADDDGAFITTIGKINALHIEDGKPEKLADFFNAFDGIHPEAGEKLKSISDTLRTFDQDFMTTLGDINALVIPKGKAGELKDFFNAFDGIHPEAGSKLASISDTLRSFGDDDSAFIATLNKITALEIPTAKSQQLTTFFNAFDGIHHEAGEKLTSLIRALKRMDEGFFGILKSLADFEGVAWNDGTLARFFNSFDGIHHEAGEKLAALVKALKLMDVPFFTTLDLISGFDADSSSLNSFLKDLNSNVTEDMGSKLSSAVSGIGKLGDAIPDLKETIASIKDLDTEDLGDVMGNIEDAFSSGIGDGISNAAEAIRDAVSAMLSAATDRSSEFTTAGEELGTSLTEGVSSKQGDAESEGSKLGKAGARGAREAYGDMKRSGEYIAQGLAAGIRAGAQDAVDAAREMANRVAAASRVALDEHSPSRVFMEIGQFVSQGFAIGIAKDSGLAVNAVSNSMDDAIKAADTKTGTLKNSTSGFYDTLIKDISNNPLTKRLEVLARHSKAAHATAVKERKLEDQEKRERAEEERKKIYKDVEEAKKGVAEAKEAKEESQKSAKDAEKSTENIASDSAKSAKDAAKQKEKITEAEEKYQKALRERDKYEYRMHGEEAGVAFVDGVAVGMMDNSEAIPSVSEILSELIVEDVENIKDKVGDYGDIFGGFSTALKTTKSMGDNVRDISRAFNRLSNATSPRSIERNIGKILDSIVEFSGGIQDLIGLISVFEPFLPGLLNSFEASLPGIAAAIAPFAPQLAATLGGGLTAALPAIAGPVGAIIASIAGIGLFLNDQANDGMMLKGLEKMFKGVLKFVASLPKRMLGMIKTMIDGLKKTVKDLPRVMTTLIDGMVGFIIDMVDAIPEVIPELVNAIIEVVAWIVLNAPAIILEIGAALVMGLVRGLDSAVKSLIRLLLSPFEWLTGKIGGKMDLFGIAAAAIQSLGRGFDMAVRAVLDLILWPFKQIFNFIGGIFGMGELGTNLVENFKTAIVNAMRFAVDAIAFPFIALWNLIAGIFGWKQLSYNTASDFIFGTTKGLDEGADKVRNSAENINRMMYEYMKSGAKNNLADVAGYVDDYMKLVETGMVEGVELGADATRNIADDAWRDIERVFDMYGLGTDELDALTKAFYEGTTNPDTIVSSFGHVYDRIEELLAMKGVGPEMVEDLNNGLNASLRQGMLDEAMAGFGKFGTNSAALLTDSMVLEMGLSKGQIVAASDDVWRNIEDVFDMAGLGKDEVDALRKAYEDGTRDPATFASTFDTVFQEIEKKLRLAGMGEDQIAALKYSMTTAINDQLNPELDKKTNETKGIFESVFSKSEGESLGASIVNGIISAITSPFRKIWDAGVNLVGNLVGGITSVISTVGNIGRSIANTALNGLGNVWDGVKGIFSRGVSFVGNLVSGITSVIGNVPTIARSMANQALNGLGNVWNGAKGIFSRGVGFVGNLVSGINSVIGNVPTVARSMANQALNGLTNVWNGAKGIFSRGAGFVGNLVSGINSVIGNVPTVARSIANQALNGLTNVWNGAKGIFSRGVSFVGNLVSGINSVVGNVPTAARSMANQALNGLGNVWNGAKGIFSRGVGFVGNLVSGINSVIGNVPTVARSMANQALNGLTNVWNGAKGIFSRGAGFVGNLVSGINSVIGNVPTVARSIANQALNGLTNVWNGAKGIFSRGVSFVGNLVSGINSVIGNVPTVARSMANQALNGLGNVWNGAKGIFSRGASFVGNLVSGINSVVGNVPTAARSMANTALNGLGNVWDGAKGIFSRGVGFVRNLIGGFDSIVDDVPRSARSIANKALNGLGNVWDGTKGIFSRGADFVGGLIKGMNGNIGDVSKTGRAIANRALDALWTVWDSSKGIFNRGVNFVGGLIDGIQNQFGRFAEEVKKLAKRALNLIGLGWLIRSPSRKAMELSGYLVEGLVLGITNNAKDLDNAVGTMGGDVLDTTRDIIAQIAEAMELDSDVTITPVIDLTNARKGMRDLSGMLESGSINIDTVTSASGLHDLSALLDGSESGYGSVTNVTNIEFNQTNTSPEPLSAYEVYQNTDRSLKTLTLSGPNR